MPPSRASPRRREAADRMTAAFPPHRRTMRHTLRVLVVAVALALPFVPALAQDDRELSEEARKQYATALQEAAVLVNSRQFDRAKEKLAALSTQRPREPRARFLKGVVEFEQGHPDAAIVVFRSL